MGMGYCHGRITKTESHSVVVVPDFDTEEEKWCPSCEQLVAIDNYYPNTARVDGLGGYCKFCDNKARYMREKKAKEREAEARQ